MFSSSADALANLFHAAARLEGAYSWEELADVLELCVEPAVKPEEPTPDPRPPVETPGPEPWQVEQIERELEPPGYEFEVEHIAADSEREPAVGMTVDAQPLDADSDEQPLERKTLFARGLIRDIVRRTLSTPVRSREPDVARIVAMMARGEPMLRIPRGRRPSLRNGVQVVCDIGDSMAPYVDDQAQLVRFMRDLLGAEFVEEIRSVGVPNLCWGARRKQLYVPPRAESPVLILSDLGIGDPPFATTRTSTEEWCEFVRGLRRAGNPVVAYVPYRRKRWPAAMRGLAEIHHWDRPVPELAPPTVSRVAPRSDEERAVGQLIESERSARPGVIELARRLALAARIEPELLRAMRVELTPWVGAGAEADIVFGGFIEASSPLYSILLPEAQSLLLRELAQYPDDLREAMRFLNAYRKEQQAPAAVQLEEDLNGLHCQALIEAAGGGPLPVAGMEAALARALRSLTDATSGADTAGLAHWALNAVPRLPRELAETRTAEALLDAARMRVKFRAIPADRLAGELDGIRSVLPRDLDTVPIGVRWTERGVEFSDPAIDGDQQIRLPDTHPRVFWAEVGDQSRARFDLEAGGTRLVPIKGADRSAVWEERYDTEVFVSAAHIDRSVTSLVAATRRALETTLRGQKVRLWRDVDEGVLQPSSIQMSRTATFLAFVSKAYLASEYCRVELESFVESRDSDDSAHSQLFVVLLDDVGRESLPDRLQRVAGHHAGDDPDSWSPVQLALDIGAALRRLRSRLPAPRPLPEVRLETLISDTWTLRADSPRAISATEMRNVPPRVPNFTGREELLTRLGKVQREAQALVGPGGIGKTAVAVEYAYRNRDRYSVVWWFHCRDVEALEEARREFETFLNDRPDLDRDRMLVIYDDVRDETDIPLPSSVSLGGSVILTGRVVDSLTVARQHVVERLDREEAIGLLVQISENSDLDGAQELVDALGGVPQAIEQAAQIMHNDRTVGYRELLKRFARDEAQSGESSATRTVEHSVDLAIEELRNNNPSAARILNLLAFFNSTSIPIQGIWEHLGIVLPEQTRSEQQAVSNALPTMEKLALLQRDGDDWSMHSLVQLAVRNRMGDRVDEYAQSAVRVVIAMFPEDPAEASQAAECEPLIPHALAVLEPEIRDAEGRVPSDSADVSELHRRLGLFALGRSDYDDAARRLARAREIAETVLEPDDPELAKYRRDVGRLYIWMGRLEEAEEIWRRELEFAERAHGSDHVDVAAALGNLAQVMSVSERLDEAESLHRRALAIIERALGPDHSGVARSLSSLGYVLGKMGRNREAEPLLRRALAIQQAADGKDDSNASETERELAALLHRTSRLKEAIEIMDHVLETQRSVRGEPNPQTARDLDFIGRIRRDMGELNVVREALARVLKLRTEADPQTGPRMRAR